LITITAASNVSFSNNVIGGITMTNRVEQFSGIKSAAGGTLKIRNNTIKNMVNDGTNNQFSQAFTYGINISAGTPALTITNNSIRNLGTAFLNNSNAPP